MERDGLRAEGEFLVLFGLCRERLENRVLETALVSFCSAHENHEGGEYDIMILTAVQKVFFVHDAAQADSCRFGLHDLTYSTKNNELFLRAPWLCDEYSLIFVFGPQFLPRF